MRDAAATRRKILDAARAEFSKFGPAGARINRIAAASGANKERIYANFGSKEGLFEAVMADALSSHAKNVGPWGTSPGDLMERLRNSHKRSPDLLRLMLWEALHYGAGPVPDEARRREHYRERRRALTETFGLADEAAGAAAMLTLIGLGAWPSAMPQLVSMVIPEEQNEAFTAAQEDLLNRLAQTILPSSDP